MEQMTGERPAKANKPMVRASRESKDLLKLLAVREPKDVGELVLSMRRDYQVTLAEKTLRAIIKTAQVKITCDSQSLAGSEAEREKVEWLTKELERLWQARLRDMLDFVAFGRVAFEKVWNYDLERGLHYLEDVEPLPYNETEMLLEECGDFAGIRLTVNDKDPLDFESIKAWWLALDASVTHPYGTSLFLGAPHEVWLERREQFRLRRVFAEKFVIGNAVGRAPTEGVVEGGVQRDPMADLDKALTDIQAGGSVVLPDDIDRETKQYKYQVQFNNGLSDAGPLKSLIDSTDVEMLRAFSLLEKCIIEGNAVGSYALVSLQMLIVNAVCDDILDQAKTSFQKYVIDPCVDLNWYAGTGPNISIGGPKLAQVPDGILIDIVKLMLTNPQTSPLVLSGAIDITAVLEAVGIPLSDVAKQSIAALLEKAKLMPLGAAPPPAPLPPEATLANPQSPGPGADPLAGLPTVEQLTEMVTEEANTLWDEAIDEMLALHRAGGLGNQFKLQLILDQLRELRADAMTASRLIGMCSPWRPELSSAPTGATRLQRALPITMSVAGVDGPFSNDPFNVRFPFIEDAVDWLREKKLVSADSVRIMAAQDKTQVFTAAGVNDIPTLQTLRTQVMDSLASGESFQEFRSKLSDDLNLTRSQTETLYRTNTKQAYTAGMEETLEDPDVAGAFPYVMFAATKDGRTRSTHWELDGFVCAVSDPAYEILRKALDDWNCRCTLIPLTSKQAEAKGIKTNADLALDVLAKYG